MHSVIGLQGMPQLAVAVARALGIAKMEREKAECMVVIRE